MLFESERRCMVLIIGGTKYGNTCWKKKGIVLILLNGQGSRKLQEVL